MVDGAAKHDPIPGSHAVIAANRDLTSARLFSEQFGDFTSMEATFLRSPMSSDAAIIETVLGSRVRRRAGRHDLNLTWT